MRPPSPGVSRPPCGLALLSVALALLLLQTCSAFVLAPSSRAVAWSSRIEARDGVVPLRLPSAGVLLAPRAAAQANGKDEEGALLTMAEIQECADAFGIELRLSTLGPFYRVIARLKDDEDEGSEPIGYTEGFVAPLFGLVHLDTMQVRRRYWKQLEGARRFRFGCGVLLGAMAMRHAYDAGCRKAELLAIYDDEKSHRLLKAFYKTAGFVEVKEVTQDLACVPDLLVWGGVGTRMDMPVAEFLRRWRSMVVSKGEEFQ